LHPLRPEIKIKDPTGPLRSRRARQKRKAKTTVSTVLNTGLSGIENFRNEIRVSDTVSTPGSSVAEPHRIPWSAWPLAVTTIALMGVSLTHLSDGVTQLTAIPSWQAWAMAVGIDCMLISTALTQLTAPADVKKDIAVGGPLHGSWHPRYVGRIERPRFHRRGIRHSPLGADRVRLFRAGGDQRGHVHSREVDAALTPGRRRACRCAAPDNHDYLYLRGGISGQNHHGQYQQELDTRRHRCQRPLPGGIPRSDAMDRLAFGFQSQRTSTAGHFVRLSTSRLCH
jgi:hypothetical protein